MRLDDIIGIFSALLRIAEIEAGAVRGNFVETDISALCRSLVDSYGFVAEDAGQVLTTDIDDGILMTGDIELITQMLVNVLENAIRHCPPDVEICLRAKRVDNVLTIELADRGPGIAESERERVFRRFIRLEDARQTKGNGLGLSLVKAIVLLHNGIVSLHDNNPGLTVRMVFQKLH